MHNRSAASGEPQKQLLTNVLQRLSMSLILLSEFLSYQRDVDNSHEALRCARRMEKGGGS